MLQGLDRVLIATRNHDKMADFCRSVLGAELSPVRVAGHTMYDGTCGPFAWLLCPAELAGIAAQDACLQLRFVVRDVQQVLARARRFGALIESDEVLEDQRTAGIVRDPDGNAWEFVQNV
ncbi:MAG: hypothetical protein ACI81R_001324 [Bradymonadia bacterium]|jgi:hypothetical protein